MNNVLIKPLITEKMTNLSAEKSQYGFIVNPKANKIDIKRAVEKKFNVHVESVRTMNYSGKTKTQFRKSGRFVGRTASFKKAIVTLKKGETIEFFEQA
ncbi:MAG: 50S ribosomal protein L23 [Ignavibacterium sp.]|nr:50S ribosomal protein L23 [Ignavibacterium sp.]MCX7612452.1 50S ribosomal protein L23 [Ignavibacterium sp.]MDW8374208.1 50S ribosomal protein L23 [Ignavibacteriales bacterium]